MLHIFLSNRPGEVLYGTPGKPVPGYEVRITNDASDPVPVGESGELQIRGPTCALHYWNNRARSCSTFNGEWTRSGDKYRQREDGYYVYEGRTALEHPRMACALSGGAVEPGSCKGADTCRTRTGPASLRSRSPYF